MLAALLFLLMFSTTKGHANSLSDEFYQQNINQSLPSNELPSEAYYNNNLRAGWDEDDGPGGSGEGENTGVGVPVGDGFVAITIATVIYSSFFVFNRKKVKKRV